MDVIRMSRIDDNTFHMQKTVDKKFRDDGGHLRNSWCRLQRSVLEI